MKKYHMDYEMNMEYAGERYNFPLNENYKKKIFINFSIFVILYLLLFILAGLANSSGSRNAFIAIPYAFLFLPIVYLAMGAFSALKLTDNMEKITYDKAIGRTSRSCKGMLFLSLYLCISDVLFLLYKHAEIHISREIVFLFICIALLIAALIQNRYLQNLKKKVIIGEHESGVPIGK